MAGILALTDNNSEAVFPRAWAWSIHRWLGDRTKFRRPFSKRGGFKRVLFLTEKNGIALSQIFPFFLYSRDFSENLKIEMREAPVREFIAGRAAYNTHIDAVCFQTWFDFTPGQISELAERIKVTWPNVTLAYLDWFAPIDLRYAEPLNSHIAAYVKKQSFRNFEDYDEPTLGDTNLSDYYAKRFHLDLPKTKFDIPPGFRQKFILGSGFEYSPEILKQLRQPPRLEERTIDLHARISTRGSVWYSYMRREAEAKVAELDSRFRLASRGYVPRRKYFAELRASKLCFSPFGYGEVCWRDFEAMSTGSMLLKHDMSHLKLATDIFRPFETYVPLLWDLSDLEEKVDYYVNHPREREAIARNAYALLSRHYLEKRFPRDIASLWQLLGLA